LAYHLISVFLGFADENVLLNVTVPHDVEYISDMEAASFLGLLIRQHCH